MTYCAQHTLPGWYIYMAPGVAQLAARDCGLTSARVRLQAAPQPQLQASTMHTSWHSLQSAAE